MYCKKQENSHVLPWMLVGIFGAALLFCIVRSVCKKCKQAENAISSCLCHPADMDDELDSDN